MFAVTGLVRQLFQKRRRSRRGKERREAVRLVESLERRLALAVDVGFQAPVGGNGERWLTVLANGLETDARGNVAYTNGSPSLADNGSDVYLQMVATPTRDLLIADNASFANAKAVVSVDAQIDNIYLFNGQVVDRTVEFSKDDTIQFGTPRGYPSLANQISRLYFSLPSEEIDLDEPIVGALDLGDGSGPTIAITNNGGAGPLEVISDRDFNIRLVPSSTEENLPYLEISRPVNFLTQWNVGSFGVPSLEITYDTDLRNVVTNRTATVGGTVDIGGTQVFKLFDPTKHEYVPGSLSGQIGLHFGSFGTQLNRDRVSTSALAFQVQESGLGLIPLSFGNDVDSTWGGPRATVAEIEFNSFDGDGTSQLGGIRIEGVFNTATGELSLETFVDADAGTTKLAIATPRPQTIPLWVEGMSIALRDLDSGDDGSDPQKTLYDPLANDVTVFGGHELTRGLIAEMPNPGSLISIESPVVATAAGGSTISLAASEVQVQSPVRAGGQFRVPSGPGQTVFGTVTESFSVEAVVGSPSFDIRLADDPETGGITRSRLLVTQTGSLSNYATVTTPVSAALPVADQIYVEVDGGDLFVEGEVAATSQSYVLRSGIGSEVEGPYRLTTQSRLTGLNTGVIRGGTVAVTLANDTMASDYSSFQTLASDVSLRTSVDRMRVQAGTRAGSTIAFPFPYNIAIVEDDNLIVDAVAASSGETRIETGGTLDLLASITSLGDISLESGSNFTVSSPISTSFGTIDITGPTVTVRNAVRVLDNLSDERGTDIAITATQGDLIVDDAVSAINGIVLKAEGPGADITGSTRVTGDFVSARASSNVAIATSANLIKVTAGGTVRIDEDTEAVFEVRNSPEVTLLAGGQDRQVVDGLSPALYADVFDTERLFVSAPNGSIDVLHKGSLPLEVGNAAAIAAAAAAGVDAESMLAGGSVMIRSTLAREVLVSDAPIATSGAIAVRFATTASLPAAPKTSFVPSPQPGVYRTDLVTELPMDVVDQSIAELGGVRATDLRVGDRILVKDGLSGYGDNLTGRVDDLIVNGVYVVRSIQFKSSTAVSLVMARATAFDTTAELGGRRYVRVTDGGANNSLRGSVYVTDGFEDSDPSEAHPTPLVVRQIASRAGFVDAEAVTTGALEASYDASNGTITALENDSLFSVAALFDGVRLRFNDKVLVQHPVDGNPTSVGLYRVAAQGATDVSPWRLVRYEGIDEDASGSRNSFYTGAVTINQGTRRTAVTGQMYEIAYESINRTPLSYQKVVDFRDPEPAIPGDDQDYLTENFDPETQYRTEIGTNNPLGTVIYEVTSEAGRNDAAGSLGKMLRLVQGNSARFAFENILEPQRYDTRIAAGVTEIELEQELPVISRRVTLLSNTGLVIDGSQVTLNRDGGIVRSSGVGSRFGPILPSTAAVARRLVRSAAPSVNLGEVNGLEIDLGASGTIIGNISIGGFENGAAIQVTGAANVLIQDAEIGLDGRGGRLPNAYGLVVRQGAGGEAGEFTTLLNSKVAANTVAGVLLDTHTNGVRLVGNTIGVAGDVNQIGVSLDSGNSGHHLIGVRQILPTAVVSGLVVTPLDAASVMVAKNTVTDSFEPGVQLFERTANRLWTVAKRLNVADEENAFVLELSGPPFAAESIGAEFTVEAGYFASVVSRSDQITLPAGVDRSRLYLGQPIGSVVAGAILNGTTITAIEPASDDKTVIGISRPIAESATTAILFGSPDRNVIGYNVNGVVLKSGSSEMYATDVSRSVFDGIRIEGVSPTGSHKIGGAKEDKLSAENVAVNGNGYSGINFTEAFFASLGSNPTLAQKLALAGQVVIQGNILGTDINQSSGLSNGRDGVSNIVFGKSVNADPNADIRSLFVSDTTRGPDGRYLAKYRPEDNPTQLSTLKEFEDFDLEGNFHFDGDLTALLSGGRGFDGEEGRNDWWNDLPLHQ